MRILVFSATWCGQCKAYHPTVEKFKKSNPGISVELIDVEEKEELVDKYGIKTLPTTIVVDDNDELIKKETGILTMDKLNELIQ